ncbi:MAG: 2-oxoacid:acceptor oxidoreductase family protein [Defluviitaleaceae bacterium]|nr:2-oxoacid:acceptor oxidoreductase family protein [Defluviitaleaceae bacterium]
MCNTTTKIIISGFGGQGILTLGQLIADIALHKGLKVTWMPSYGAEMRGGTANCSVIISSTTIGSPMVKNNIDILCALNGPSLGKFLGAVASGGKVFINSSIVDTLPNRGDVDVVPIDATNIAAQAGNAKAANMVMLAGFLKQTSLFTIEDVKEALERRFEGKEGLVDVNMKALESAL